MVKEYLERTKQELIEQKLMIQKDIIVSQNRMKENTKFIELLEDSNDPNYDAFTPRETNSFNRKKISELQENQKNEFEHLASLQDEMQIVESKINEIVSVMKEFSAEHNSIVNRMNLMRANDRRLHRLSSDLLCRAEDDQKQFKEHIDLCEKFLNTDPERMRLEINAIQQLLEQQNDWMLNYSYEIYPALDDGTSFEQKLQQLIQQIKNYYKLQIDFHSSGNIYRLDNVIQITILFAIRELCENVMKHSGVNRIMIGLTYESEGVLLNVSDNGHGFDYESILQNSDYGVTKLGFYLIKKKIDFLDGNMSVDSALQKGCSIQIFIPKN